MKRMRNSGFLAILFSLALIVSSCSETEEPQLFPEQEMESPIETRAVEAEGEILAMSENWDDAFPINLGNNRWVRLDLINPRTEAGGNLFADGVNFIFYTKAANTVSPSFTFSNVKIDSSEFMDEFQTNFGPFEIGTIPNGQASYIVPKTFTFWQTYYNTGARTIWLDFTITYNNKKYTYTRPYEVGI